MAAAIIWVFKYLFWSREKKEIQQDAPVTPSITQTFQPVINIHSPTITSSDDARKQPSNPDSNSLTKRMPHFSYKGPSNKRIFISPEGNIGIRDPRDSREENAAANSLLLRFENEPQGARANRVVAKVSFKTSNGLGENLDYGVWLNSPNNWTSMNVGDTRELLIIAVTNSKLLAFDDRRIDGSYYSQWSWMTRRTIEHLEEVEVRLIDQNTVTSRRFIFLIRYDGEKFTVQERISEL